MTRIVSWDVETFLIQPGRLAPPLVCATFAEVNQPGFLLGKAESIKHMHELLADPDVLLLAHNGAYDTAVMMAEDETLIPAFFAAYDAGRILDTKIREELMDIAVGRKQDSGKMLVLREKGWEPVKYHLADLTMRYLGIDRTSEKNDPQGWRLRYAELAGVPTAQWPSQAIEYAIADAETTLAVYYEQQKRAEALKYTDGLHVTDEKQQVKAALALHLASCWGMRTDGQRVAALKLKYEAMKDKLFGRLKKVGFYRIGGTKKEPKWQKDTKKVKAYVERVYEKHPDGQPPKTEKGAVSTDRLTLEDSGSRLLKSLADLGAIDKILTTYLPVLEAGTVTPINTRFNILVSTGRTSSQQPNLQNIPGGKVLGGVRECFIPRPDNVYCSVDYAQLELCTFGQALLTMFGISNMADAINSGHDLHNKLAIRLAELSSGWKITYEESLELKKIKDKAFKKQRDVAKEINFGGGGGMGANTFRRTVYKSIRQKMTDRDARFVLKAYKSVWNLEPYFIFISELVGMGSGKVTHLVSKRQRGECGYTEAANSFFQGLAADLVKEAMWRVCREMYAVPDSPLYGSRLNAAIHDELFAELPESRATSAAKRMTELMLSVAETYTPDVRLSAEPALMRYWTKEAGTKYTPEGELIVHE